MSCVYNLKLISVLYWLNTVSSIGLMETPSFIAGDVSDSEVYQFLNIKDYLPNEGDLPKTTIVKNVEDDATYVLSKLSDEELIKLLNQQPNRKEFNLNDLMKITNNNMQGANAFNTRAKPRKDEQQKAFFKLENKVVDPYNFNNDADPKYNALLKLNNMLYSRPQQQSEENDENNEMLFDVLVAQLKALCCKTNKPNANKKISKLKTLLNKILGQKTTKQPILSDKVKFTQKTENTKEHIFLIVNDEINSNVTGDLIAVDPDSLSKNSSVLLLGPITTPLSDGELMLVMKRIAVELSRPEYLPLLQKISEGNLLGDNLDLMKSLLSGPDSRRYIKPHRCNHQSKLAKIYGGPKWLICTGYLNLNTPSLYD